MKRIQILVKPVKAITVVFMGLLLALNSCKKNQSEQTDEKINIQQIKSWYDNNRSTFYSYDNVFFKAQPNWDDVYVSFVDGKYVAEVGIKTTNLYAFNSKGSSASEKDLISKNTDKKLLFFISPETDKLAFAYVIYTEKDGNNIKNIHYNEPANYTGSIMYFNAYGEFENGYSVENGNVNQKISKGKGNDLLPDKLAQKIARSTLIPNTKIMLGGYDCYETTYTYSEYHCGPDIAQSIDIAQLRNFKNMGGGSNCGWYDVWSYSTVHCTNNGGGSGTTYTGATAATTDLDPCSKKPAINAMQSNSTIIQLKASILAHANDANQHEWGALQNLNSLTGASYKDMPLVEGGQDSTVLGFNWNATDGYSTGSMHFHPEKGAPSPQDAFSMLINLGNNQLQTEADINYYKQNVTTTIVTTEGTYVVTVKNWNQLNACYQTFLANDTAYEDTYNGIAGQYATDYPSSTKGEQTLFALLSLLNKAVYVYKAEPNSTNFKLMEAGITPSDTLILREKICPN